MFRQIVRRTKHVLAHVAMNWTADARSPLSVASCKGISRSEHEFQNASNTRPSRSEEGQPIIEEYAKNFRELMKRLRGRSL